MSLLPEIPNPYLAALGIGFSYGLVYCTSSCLPYISSYIAGIGAGFRRGVAVTLIFNAGRLTAYALIGVLFGLFQFIVDEAVYTVFQTYASLIFGVVTIAIGVTILIKNKPPSCDCPVEHNGNGSVGTRGFASRFDLRAYFMGLSRGLILCTPMLAIMAYSVSFASPVDSFYMAVLFGLGTVLSPIILLGGATGWLLNKAPLFRKWISRLGAVALIILGAVAVVNTIII
ncbi:MAG: sulfite exporter TauE/SafE family protein [Candidatus Bathyarchaeota archaeon]|nr:sulfite exporter TauE/SafE family protein [Candidatus Bathyarchaeota archaeon]